MFKLLDTIFTEYLIAAGDWIDPSWPRFVVFFAAIPFGVLYMGGFGISAVVYTIHPTQDVEHVGDRFMVFGIIFVTIIHRLLYDQILEGPEATNLAKSYLGL